MGAAGAGLLLGIYGASWGYAEATIFGVATSMLGLDPNLAAGLLGVAGMTFRGIGILAFSGASRRLAPLLAPLPALAYLAAMLGGGWLVLALAYPLMAIAVTLVGSVVVGYLLDTSRPEDWPRLMAVLRITQTLTSGVVLGVLLMLNIGEAPVLAALAGIPLVSAALSAPVLVPMRRVERLSKMVDDMARALVTLNPESRRIHTGLYLAAALAGVGLVAGARFQLTMLLSDVDFRTRLHTLAAYYTLFSLGAMAATIAPSPIVSLALGLTAWPIHASLDPLTAFIILGGIGGYADTSLSLYLLNRDPLSPAWYSGFAVLSAAAGVLGYSVSPPLATAVAGAVGLAALASWARERVRVRWQ